MSISSLSFRIRSLDLKGQIYLFVLSGGVIFVLGLDNSFPRKDIFLLKQGRLTNRPNGQLNYILEDLLQKKHRFSYLY